MTQFPLVHLDKYSHTFPDPLKASKDGLLAFGGDLNPDRIMHAYKNGIFPWYSNGEPILWWSPDPRFVLDIDNFKISKSLARTIKKGLFEIKFNTSFSQVIMECSKSPRTNQNGTWIVPEMIEAYIKLHTLGYAHSFEAWLNGKLVGGGYGVSIGNIFCGESMFTKYNDASKIAFYELVQHLKNKGFQYIDSQIYTEHLERFGAKEIKREIYIKYLNDSLLNPKKFY